jgi:hypothetical protein
VTDPDTVYRRDVTAGGRVRYVPIGRLWDSPVWPEGAHLVVVRDGRTTTHYRIDPDLAGCEAALVDAGVREAMARALMAAREPRPDARGVRCWCPADVVEAGLAVLREAVLRKRDNAGGGGNTDGAADGGDRP